MTPSTELRRVDPFIKLFERADGLRVDENGNPYTGYTFSGTYFENGRIDDSTPPLFFRFGHMFLAFLQHKNVWELK